MAGPESGRFLRPPVEYSARYVEYETRSGSGNATLPLPGSNSGTNTLAQTINDGASSGTTTLTKSGAGAWLLSGTNTFSGSSNQGG